MTDLQTFEMTVPDRAGFTCPGF